jgi:hypothetical protein
LLLGICWEDDGKVQTPSLHSAESDDDDDDDDDKNDIKRPPKIGRC